MEAAAAVEAAVEAAWAEAATEACPAPAGGASSSADFPVGEEVEVRVKGTASWVRARLVWLFKQ